MGVPAVPGGGALGALAVPGGGMVGGPAMDMATLSAVLNKMANDNSLLMHA